MCLWLVELGNNSAMRNEVFMGTLAIDYHQGTVTLTQSVEYLPTVGWSGKRKRLSVELCQFFLSASSS